MPIPSHTPHRAPTEQFTLRTRANKHRDVFVFRSRFTAKIPGVGYAEFDLPWHLLTSEFLEVVDCGFGLVEPWPFQTMPADFVIMADAMREKVKAYHTPSFADKPDCSLLCTASLELDQIGSGERLSYVSELINKKHATRPTRAVSVYTSARPTTRGEGSSREFLLLDGYLSDQRELKLEAGLSQKELLINRFQVLHEVYLRQGENLWQSF